MTKCTGLTISALTLAAAGRTSLIWANTLLAMPASSGAADAAVPAVAGGGDHRHLQAEA